MFKSFVIAITLALGLSGCTCCESNVVEPERLNNRTATADQASERTPTGTMLGTTFDKGPEKYDIPILNKILKDE